MSAFDALSASRDLEAAGMERFGTAMKAGPADSAEAFKADLERFGMEFKADLKRSRMEFKADPAAFETDMTWRFAVAAVVIVAAIELVPDP